MFLEKELKRHWVLFKMTLMWLWKVKDTFPIRVRKEIEALFLHRLTQKQKVLIDTCTVYLLMKKATYRT